MNQKDQALLDFIINGTLNGTVRWEATADENEFLATLRGSHSLSITRAPGNNPDVLSLRNSLGQEILTLDATDDGRINSLFTAARRNAFNVDKTIDEIIGSDQSSRPRSQPKPSSAPITDEDIPF